MGLEQNPEQQSSEQISEGGEKSIPDDHQEKIAELIDLYHTEIHLPLVHKALTPEEEHELTSWANSLSYEELADEIRKRREKIDKDMRDQWPRGLTRP